MRIELNGVTLDIHANYTTGISAEPQECHKCHRVSYFFTNRNGETTCTSCDTLRSSA
ncbi:MAG: hypothetical protein OEY86_07525 [Nitrospira sp.]|nr:hypothetical protein [Nitrospira sp.]